MQQLHIRLLGEFALVYGDKPVTEINSARLQSLFAYLLLHSDAPQSRNHLAYLFWPDSIESQALNNLRKALHFLRQKLPDASCYLAIDAKSVQWRTDSPFTLDVLAYESALKFARAHVEPADRARLREQLTQAINLYTGDLLPQCYDDWLIEARERLRDQYMNALADLIDLLEESRDYTSAIRLAQQRLRLDPLSESAHRHLMQLHVLNGDSSSALRVYHVCVSILQTEFGVPPGALTQQVYERLIHPTEQAVASLTTPAAALMETTKLVGRHSEWQQLVQAWQAAARGRAQCFIIAGEAGMGKSRLATELLNWVGQHDALTAHARAYAAEGALAFSPVASWLRSDGYRQLWQRMDAVWLVEVSRVLPELRADVPGLPEPQPITDGWQRKQLYEALARTMLAAGRPTLLVLDDLQWCDRETLEWLHFLMRFDAHAPLLLVGTLRLGEMVNQALDALLMEMRVQQQVIELELAALNQDETLTLASLVAGQPLPPALAQTLYQDTEGNPLFVVEMARAQTAISGQSIRSELPRSTSMLPPRVQAMIQARFAQLSPPAQTLAHAAAVIGRDFTALVLANVCEKDIAPDSFVPALDELWKRRIVRDRGADAYDFSHDRIRDVVLASLSPARRTSLHRSVAHALEHLHAGDIDAVSGQLAVHYECAGLFAEAAQHYYNAAKVASKLSAFEDQIALLKRGLKMLSHLPASLERARQRTSFLLELGMALLMTRPGGDLEMAQVYAEARALSEPAGQEASLFRAQRGLWVYHLLRGELQLARDYAAQNMAVARQIDTQPVLGDAARCLAMAEWFMGDIVQANQHMQSAIELMPPAYFLAHHGVFDDTFGTDGMSAGAQMLWQLGFPDRAEQQSAAGLTFSRALKLPFSAVMALEFHAHIHAALHHLDEVHAAGAEMLALSEKYEIAQYTNIGHVILGWAMAAEGKPAEGEWMIRQGIADCLTTQMESMLTLYNAMLAQALIWQGQHAQALDVIEGALAMAQRNHEYFWLAELHRLKGDILLALRSVQREAEASYWQALDVARGQSTHSFELRAAMSLARLMQREGRLGDARGVLAPALAWFSEGFETHDLREAGTLLAELKHA